MKRYKISVIIPTYNAENYLKDCIDSLINQTLGFDNIEVILVDDQSTDSTQDILNDFSAKYENVVTIFNKDNSGSPSKPRNIGIQNATSDYIMFMDNDDYYYPEMCEVMYRNIVNENADIVTCRFIFNKNNEESIKEKTFLDDYDKIIKINSVYEMPQLMTTSHPGFIWNKIFKKNLLIKHDIHFPENALYEDIYFMIQAYLNANGILLLNDFWGYCYIVRTKGENKSTSENFNEKNLLKQFKGLKLIFNKLDEYGADFPSLEGEMLVGWTKLFIFTNPKNKKALLKKARKFYKRYKWDTRLFTISLPLNICINIFMKIFSINISIAIFITKFVNFLISLNLVSKSRRSA